MIIQPSVETPLTISVGLRLIRGKHLLIDGDIILYKCGFAFDKAQAEGSADSYESVVNVTIDSIRRNCGSDSYEVWLTGTHNFREIISSTYKANRKDRPKPTKYKEIKEFLIHEHGAQVSTGAEADDEIAIRLTEAPRERVCISNDKDYRQVSGWSYNPFENRVQWTSRKAGDYFLYQQILEGDQTDNIQGIRGIGPKKAEKILAGSGSSRELCQRVWNTYKFYGYSADQFVETAKLVYLHRRHGDEYSSPIILE